MSAIKAVYEAALADLHAAAAKLEAIGHTAWERVKEIAHEVEGDVPKLEAEAAADAEDVAKTAETQGVAPAVAEAEKDGVTLAEDAAHDVAAAVEGSAKLAEPASTTTTQTAAVIAGEAAVAAEQHSA